jgi:antitoxin component HigA of HigAB toxin-antitoxin module
MTIKTNEPDYEKAIEKILAILESKKKLPDKDKDRAREILLKAMKKDKLLFYKTFPPGTL